MEKDGDRWKNVSISSRSQLAADPTEGRGSAYRKLVDESHRIPDGSKHPRPQTACPGLVRWVEPKLGAQIVVEEVSIGQLPVCD